MNVTNLLLSDRTTRILLFFVLGLIGLAFLFFGESTTVRILGPALAVLIGVIFKAVAELRLDLTRMRAEDSRRVDQALARFDDQSKAAFLDVELRQDRVEASVAQVALQATRAQEEASRQVGAMRDEIQEAFAELSRRMDEGGMGRHAGRTHSGSDGDGLRELGLSDSLSGLASGSKLEAAPDD